MNNAQVLILAFGVAGVAWGASALMIYAKCNPWVDDFPPTRFAPYEVKGPQIDSQH